MTIQKIQSTDTFQIWMQKLNALIDDFNVLTIDSSASNGFTYDAASSAGLNVKIAKGRIRSGSETFEIAAQTVNLPPASDVIVCATKPVGLPATLAVYTTTTLPTEHVIPLWTFTTNNVSVTAFNDVRTPYGESGASNDEVGPIIYFEKHITSNRTVKSIQNALSIDPIVDAGVTVTVELGATWVVL